MNAPDDGGSTPKRARAARPPDAESAGRWGEFLRLHSDWMARFPPGALVYSLPPRLVAALKGPMRIGDDEVAAERELRRLCSGCRAVGIRDGAPVVHRWLAPGSSEPARGRSIAARNSGAKAKGSKSILGDSDLRLKGYLGRLLTHPDFLAAFAGLRAAWSALPAAGRPRLPIRRADLAPAAGGGGFAGSFVAFCDRWALAGVVAWDLPEPQAPIVSAAPPPARPPGVHVVLPFHHDLEADRELLLRIRQAQREQAGVAGLAAAAALPNYEAFARMLEILHWEGVATGRYLPTGRRSAGFVGPLVRGVAGSLGMKEDQVKKWRKAISALRRGRLPASIPALRTRS